MQLPHVAFFDRVRRLLPGRPPSGAFERGVYALERRQFDAAATALDEALALAATPRDVAAVRNKRAIVAVHRRDLPGAIGELITALEADPRSAAAITTLGNLLLEEGVADDAIAHYEYAILVDDLYAPAYHNLGVALHRAGRRGEAVRNLRKATRLESRMKRRNG